MSHLVVDSFQFSSVTRFLLRPCLHGVGLHGHKPRRQRISLASCLLEGPHRPPCNVLRLLHSPREIVHLG